MEYISKVVFMILGLIWAFIEPTFHHFGICVAMVLLDCYTAWRLNRRVASSIDFKANAKSPEFKSRYALKMFNQLLIIYSLIAITWWVDVYVNPSEIKIASVLTLVFVAIEVLSILENESSCNGAKWAKTVQRFVVDKTERHLKFDLNEDNKIGEKTKDE